MDLIITNFMREWHVPIHKGVYILGFIIAFVCICGIIRFSIAVYRRQKGIYPPATSQMEDH